MRFADHRQRRVLRGRTGLLCFLMFALPIEAQCADVERRTPSIASALEVVAPESLIVQIKLNQENKGDFFVTASDGDFLIRVQDLKAIGLTQGPGQFLMI